MSINDDIRKCCQVLHDGGIILYPTDTVWGIGCDATNSAAVERVYALKQRIDSKALLVLVDSMAKVEFYVDTPCPLAYDIVELATSPITIIYDHARNLADNLLAEDGTCGIRVTMEQYSRELCRRFGRAIVSTSANISGQPSPASFADISEEIISGVDYVAEYRPKASNANSKPSSIVKLTREGVVTVIR